MPIGPDDFTKDVLSSVAAPVAGSVEPAKSLRSESIFAVHLGPVPGPLHEQL